MVIFGFIVLVVVCIPLVCWVLKKLKVGENTNQRILIAIIPSLILSALIFYGVVFFVLFGDSIYFPRSFDKQSWIEQEDTRYKMTGDIIDSEMLLGKTLVEVEAFLGNEHYQRNSNQISYYIGYTGGFRIDPDVLTITFENDKVVKVLRHGT